jgi:hypothetical protein
MSRPLPSDDQVRQAMTLVLTQARDTGRRPTITAVERQLRIAHPTFYRNFPDLITWFKRQAIATAESDTSSVTGTTDTGTDQSSEQTDLRRDNRELRARVALYAEAIRQLTLDNAGLRAELDTNARIVDLTIRQRERTTDRNEDPS